MATAQAQTTNGGNWITLREAARSFDVPIGTIKGWVHRGLLSTQGNGKVGAAPGGRVLLVDPRDVRLIVESPPTNGRPPRTASSTSPTT